MELQIQDLVSSIKKDGIDSANKEAAVILTDAKKQADALLAEARKEADKLRQDARDDAEVFKSSALLSAQQAKRDAVLAFSQAVQKEFEKLLASDISKALDEKALADLIRAALRGEEPLAQAVAEAARKKKQDYSAVEFLSIEEGLCVQLLHVGPFDDEPASVALMDAYLAENGYENDFSDTRLHHEIYLSDARRVDPSQWRTVIRHPIRRRQA